MLHPNTTILYMVLPKLSHPRKSQDPNEYAADLLISNQVGASPSRDDIIGMSPFGEENAGDLLSWRWPPHHRKMRQYGRLHSGCWIWHFLTFNPDSETQSRRVSDVCTDYGECCGAPYSVGCSLHLQCLDTEICAS